MSRPLPVFCHLIALVTLVSVCATAQQPLRQPLITRPINEAAVVTLQGNTHPLARPQFDIGVAPPDLPMDRMLLVLKRSPQQDFAVHKLLDDQQDKNSPSYHRWMTPVQFGTQFGGTDQDIQLITGWLQTHGFQINQVSNGRSVIEFSGVESQVEQTFHTQIHRYMLPSGEQHWANASEPQIPAALVPAVAGVWSLHDFRKQPRIVTTNAPVAISSTRSVPLTNLGSGRHGILPADFATIYNLNVLYREGIDGQGATIAVVARSNIKTSDILDFRSISGLSLPLNMGIINNGPDPGIYDIGEEFEADLDASWSDGVAPGARVNFVVSASTNTTDGVDLSELYIVDKNLGDVMTESFGSCEGFASQSEAQGLSMLAEQAAAEGITYMVSSGDSGAEGCVSPGNASANGSIPSVNVLASPPFVVAVGGTMFNENGNDSAYWNSTNNVNNLSSAKSYIPENVWNESCPNGCGLWSGGGGVSTFFSKPNWQFGVAGIPNDGHRDQPDVALTAALHDAYLLCIEGSCQQGLVYLTGGTSASSPSFAGIMALVVQQYGRQGLANYVLYRLAAAETLSKCNGSNTAGLPNAVCIFNDVTVGNNAVPGELNYGTASALYQAGTGYDLATGLGSVNAYNLVTSWNTVTFNATTTTLGPSTITSAHGTPVSLNISVAPSSGSGIPSGDVSLQTALYNTANAGFVTLDNTGSATAQVSNLPGGNYTLTARYGGDATYAPSTSAGVQVNITPENSVTTASILTVAPNGAPIPFTSGPFGGFVYPRADVAGQSGNGVPTGSVLFQDNGGNFSMLTLNSRGNAAPPNGYWSFGAGQHSLTAAYQGDSSFNPSTSGPVTFVITPATTNMSLNANPASGPLGSSITLTANLASSAFAGAPVFPTYPSGTVTFWQGATQIGSAPVFASSQTQTGITASASFSTSSLPNGSNSITAQYGGDTNYTAGSSPPITVSISADFAFAVGTNSVTVSRGSSVTNTLTITGQSGYNNTISFTASSCGGIPYLATCSFSPPTVTGTGNTTVTIATTAPSSAAVRGIGFMTVGVLFAGVLLMGVPSRRVRSYGALSVILCVLAFDSIACGGGSSGSNNNHVSNSGTFKGSYPITITATTSDHAVSHTVSFTLVVQ